MNERRQKIVEKAYKTLDRDGSGTLTIADIGIYLKINKKRKNIFSGE